jgi:RNAse (barnase) inhibitor barstar
MMVVLDLKKVKCLEEFYDVIQETFCPGSKVGQNLDSLNDILRGGWKYKLNEQIQLNIIGNKKKLLLNVSKWNKIEYILHNHENITEVVYTYE